MPIIHHEYPILEYSSQESAVINPRPAEAPFPRLCLMTFFREPLARLVEQYKGRVIGTYRSEMRPFEVYALHDGSRELCAVQAAVGAAASAMLADWLYGKGVETILCCGSCGVLEDIPAGDVILPVRALRDEGASYHYLPPARFIELDEEPILAACAALEKAGAPYIRCTTCTTDGFYRETPEMVAYRRSEGCQVVEMECAALAAVARFRGKRFGTLLYSGDILANPAAYDDRNWAGNHSARDKLMMLTLRALMKL